MKTLATWLCLVWTLGFVVAACQKAGLHGGKDGGKEGGGKATDGTDGVEIPPDEVVDEPQQVAGAALTCVAAFDADSDTNAAAGWLCRVDQDGKAADIARAAVTWRAVDPSATATFASLSASPPWHVFVRYPTASDDARIAADVKAATGDSYTVMATLPTDGKTIWHVGAGRDIHLGDGDYIGGGCKGPISETPLTGANVSIPLTVTSESSLVTIELVDVCGIDYDEVEFVISNAGGPVHKARLPVGMPTFSVVDFKLLKGEYSVLIEPTVSERGGDRDDFVFGGAFLSGSGIAVGQPK